jgi:hypothetical protein
MWRVGAGWAGDGSGLAMTIVIATHIRDQGG